MEKVKKLGTLRQTKQGEGLGCYARQSLQSCASEAGIPCSAPFRIASASLAAANPCNALWGQSLAYWPRYIQALVGAFSTENFWLLATVALLFVFGKSYLIMDYLGLKDSSR
jgi:hypothetical protein